MMHSGSAEWGVGSEGKTKTSALPHHTDSVKDITLYKSEALKTRIFEVLDGLEVAKNCCRDEKLQMW